MPTALPVSSSVAAFMAAANQTAMAAALPSTTGGNGGTDSGKIPLLNSRGGFDFGSTSTSIASSSICTIKGTGAGFTLAVTAGGGGFAIDGSPEPGSASSGFQCHLSTAGLIGYLVDGTAATATSVAFAAGTAGQVLSAADASYIERVAIFGDGRFIVRDVAHGFAVTFAAPSTLASDIAAAWPTVAGTVLTSGNIGSNVAGLSTNTFTDAQTMSKAGSANTRYDGVILANTTSATNTNQQYSPSLVLKSNQYTGSASTNMDWAIYAVPIQQAFVNGAINFDVKYGAGAYSTLMKIVDYNNTVTITTGSAGTAMYVGSQGGSGPTYLLYNNAAKVSIDGSGVTTTGNVLFDKTITAAGTTGAQTINKTTGSVNFAAGATSLVVTNSLCTTSSVIMCTVGTNDTTMKSAAAVSGSGSFTIYANAAATAETKVFFIITN